uniref:PB1 domain-containing protein n=1 Tax=Setaria italica TaxID=4555 RepID=K3ZHC2_SETIT
MDGIGTSVCGAGSPPDMDSFTLSDFDGLERYTDLGAGISVDDSVLSALCSSLSSEEQAEAGASISEDGDSPDGSASGEVMHMCTATLPKSIHGAAITLPERMLRALAMLKDASSGSGAILAQVWMPVRYGERQVLTTSDQPFLLDQRLTGYREISRKFIFSASEGPEQFPGLPGRVFISCMPEWTSNVMYYHDSEYLRVDHAARHEVRGSLAVPVIDSSGPSDSCCAVLEVVMTQEKDNFMSEIDSISKALQSVNLSTVKAWTYPQNLTRNQESAFTEISDVLQTVCHAHMLPLALVWVPFCSSSNANVSIEYGDQDMKFNLRKKDLLCIHESACYANDMRMHYFVRACGDHPLERGQGVAGNVILSNSPFFSCDVKDYDVCDYPLAHHARKFGLQAAVAIRLRSTYTGSDDYVLEYFLPLMCKGCDEQQRLLDDIAETMQRACKSLRTVSNSELMADTTVKPSNKKGCRIRFPSSDMSINSGHKLNVISTIKANVLSGHQKMNTNELLGDMKRAKKLKPSTTSHGEKTSTSMEKNISLSVLQKYFAGSLKDASKSLGVCPTTLKRICRQHGISRWPSRKIKKVNRSLEKIQNVISSVHGVVDRELKYDPATGFLISSISPSGNPLLIDVEGDGVDPPHIESESSQLKIKLDCGASQGEYQGQLVLKAQEEKLSEIDFSLNEGRLSLNSHSSVGSQGNNASRDLFLVPQSNIGTETLPSSSSKTDYSSGSASSHGTFQKCSKTQASANEGNTTVTVKANYKDDAVRFKLLPSMKHHDLLEEIAKRMKLSVGSFHLKYRDDEDDWVILESDADLQECLDILEITRSHVLKVQVRDVTHPAASSGSSSFAMLCKACKEP